MSLSAEEQTERLNVVYRDTEQNSQFDYIAIAPDGCIYAAGSSLGSDLHFLAKYDWELNLLDSIATNDYANGLAVGLDGSVYLSSMNSIEQYDSSLIKQNTVGYRGGREAPGYFDIAIGHDGFVYSIVTIAIGGLTESRYEVHKFDRSLNLIESVVISDSLAWGERVNDYLNHIAVAADGTVFVSGSVADSVEKRVKAVIVKCDRYLEVKDVVYLEREDFLYRLEGEYHHPGESQIIYVNAPLFDKLDTTPDGLLVALAAPWFEVGKPSVILFDGDLNIVAEYRHNNSETVLISFCISQYGVIYVAGTTFDEGGSQVGIVIKLDGGFGEANAVSWSADEFRYSVFNDISVAVNGSVIVVGFGSDGADPWNRRNAVIIK